MVVKDFLGNVLEAGNTIAYAISKDALVLFKILEVTEDGRLRSTRLDNNPTGKTSLLGYNWSQWGTREEYVHSRAVKLWLTFEENKQ